MSTLFDKYWKRQPVKLTSLMALNNSDPAPDDLIEVEEKRTERRFTSAYLPCLLVTMHGTSISIIRNLSYGGANVRTNVPLSVGEEVCYAWGTQNPVRAKVAWIENGLCGLENIEVKNALVLEFPYRAVRVRGLAEARLFTGSESTLVKVHNISLGGLCASGLHPWWKDRLVTVRICGFELPNVCVRWRSNGQTGLTFASRLSPADLEAIISHKDFSPQFDF